MLAGSQYFLVALSTFVHKNKETALIGLQNSLSCSRLGLRTIFMYFILQSDTFPFLEEWH